MVLLFRPPIHTAASVENPDDQNMEKIEHIIVHDIKLTFFSLVWIRECFVRYDVVYIQSLVNIPQSLVNIPQSLVNIPRERMCPVPSPSPSLQPSL